MVPDHSSIVYALFNAKTWDLVHDEGLQAFTEAVVDALHAVDSRWGHLKKSSGQRQINGHAEDAALYLHPDGTAQAVDFISGAGSRAAKPGWLVDEPRYTQNDWINPRSLSIPPPTLKKLLPYPGDFVFDQVGKALFDDYALVGNAPDPAMARWFGRIIYDALAGITKNLDESIAKHQNEWRAILASYPGRCQAPLPTQQFCVKPIGHQGPHQSFV